MTARRQTLLIVAQARALRGPSGRSTGVDATPSVLEETLAAHTPGEGRRRASDSHAPARRGDKRTRG